RETALWCSTMSDVPPINTALGRLRVLETYIRYDGPKLFACENIAGQIFLALFVDDRVGAELYLYVPVSRERWLSVRRGSVALRNALENPEDGHVFEVLRPLDGSDPTIRIIRASDIDTGWLPEPDVILRLPEIAPSQFSIADLSTESVRRVRPVAAL